MRILSVLIFILSVASVGAAPQPYRLAVQQAAGGERHLAEVFALELTLDVDAPFHLDLDSLPAAGRVGLHLQQGDVRVQRGWPWSTRRYSLLVPYQVIGQSAVRTYVTVPSLVFQLIHAEQSYPLVIEPFSVDIVAGFDLSERLAGEPLALAESRVLPLLEAERWKIALVSTGLLLFALCLLVFWQLVGRPRWQRYNRPFACARRALRRRPSQPMLESQLRILHRALDASANETVLSCDVSRFVQRFPQFTAIAAEFELFFEASDRCFYATDEIDTGSATAASIFDVEALVERCAQIEAET